MAKNAITTSRFGNSGDTQIKKQSLTIYLESWTLTVHMNVFACHNDSNVEFHFCRNACCHILDGPRDFSGSGSCESTDIFLRGKTERKHPSF